MSCDQFKAIENISIETSTQRTVRKVVFPQQHYNLENYKVVRKSTALFLLKKLPSDKP